MREREEKNHPEYYNEMAQLRNHCEELLYRLGSLKPVSLEIAFLDLLSKVLPLKGLKPSQSAFVNAVKSRISCEGNFREIFLISDPGVPAAKSSLTTVGVISYHDPFFLFRSKGEFLTMDRQSDYASWEFFDYDTGVKIPRVANLSDITSFDKNVSSVLSSLE